MEWSNSPRNCLSEVWYMVFTIAISDMRKYRILPRVATGLNSSRASLILISVSAAICSFWLTSRAVALVTCNTLIRSSSSTREPCRINKAYSQFKSLNWNIHTYVYITSVFGQGIHLLHRKGYWDDPASHLINNHLQARITNLTITILNLCPSTWITAKLNDVFYHTLLPVYW